MTRPFKFHPNEISDGIVIIEVPLPLSYRKSDIAEQIFLNTGGFADLVFAEKDELGQFHAAALPEMFNANRKVHVFEVPDSSKRYAIARLLTELKNVRRKTIRKIGPPVLVPLTGNLPSDCARRLGRLFRQPPGPPFPAPVAVADHTDHFADGTRMRIVSESMSGASAVVLFDWESLRRRSRHVAELVADPPTLEFCIGQFQKPAWVVYTCGACRRFSCGVALYTFHTLPDRFVVQLMRFRRDGSKDDTPITYSDTLTIPPARYRLYGVCEHSGGILGGHYAGFVRGGDSRWVRIDGAQASLVAAPAVHSPLAYLLFYERE
jgi:hypothetical protein